MDRDLDDGHLLKPYLEFMGTAMEELIPKLNPNNGIICWVIGDVGDLNLAKEVAEMSKNISVLIVTEAQQITCFGNYKRLTFR